MMQKCIIFSNFVPIIKKSCFSTGFMSSKPLFSRKRKKTVYLQDSPSNCLQLQKNPALVQDYSLQPDFSTESMAASSAEPIIRDDLNHYRLCNFCGWLFDNIQSS